MFNQSTDRLVSGAVTGALLTAAIVILTIWLDLPSWRHADAFVRLAVPAAISAALLFPRPLLLRTVWKSRRDPWVFDEDLDQLMRGRAVGLVGGMFIGITLAGQML
ncbi:hypothetical protein [Paraburkholderia adhaesiva]|uniref:hypothetical protein n=1 Tax=Paraburkholderia adhaesiva TaxID=2883244 RepID=UPI001F30B102|nr:hypothetical protein [Paraburkholderia adhaesiva]